MGNWEFIKGFGKHYTYYNVFFLKFRLDAKTLCLAQSPCIMPTIALFILMSMKLKLKRAEQFLKINVRVTVLGCRK